MTCGLFIRQVTEKHYIGVEFLHVYLRPAVVEGVVGLDISEPLNSIKPAECVNLPLVSRHLVSPARGFQTLHLYPLVKGTVIFPHIMRCLFTPCINENSRENCQQLYE